MQKIFKVTDNEWLVKMTEDEYKSCYYKVSTVATVEVDIVSVQPTYFIKNSFLKIKLRGIPSLKLKPGMKMIISIKE